MSLSARAQRGATLVVGLVMLLVFTLLASSAFNLSSTNLKVVDNLQVREESVAAANAAIEQVTGTNFVGSLAQTITVTLSKDAANSRQYSVRLQPPVCIKATLGQNVSPSSVNLALPGNTWNTVWQLTADVDDPLSGGSATVRTGVRVLLSEAQRNNRCP